MVWSSIAQEARKIIITISDTKTDQWQHGTMEYRYEPTGPSNPIITMFSLFPSNLHYKCRDRQTSGKKKKSWPTPSISQNLNPVIGYFSFLPPCPTWQRTRQWHRTNRKTFSLWLRSGGYCRWYVFKQEKETREAEKLSPLGII